MSGVYGPKTIASVNANASDTIDYIVNKVPGLSIEQAKSLVNSIVNLAIQKTTADGIRWIDDYVPKRTGQLQDSLKRNLQSSSLDARNNLTGLLKTGTNLKYAPYVDKMNTTQVRHSGEIGYAYYYGFHGKLTLNDPKAVGGFWGLLKQYLRDRLRKNLRNAIRQMSSIAGVSAQPISNKLKVQRRN